MVPALGLRRAARTGDAGSLPLIVMLVTVAMAGSGTCALVIGLLFGASLWLLAPVVVKKLEEVLSFSPEGSVLRVYEQYYSESSEFLGVGEAELILSIDSAVATNKRGA